MKTSPGARKRDLAVVHVLKKQLAMDDDTYRDVMQSKFGMRSAADLDAYQLRQLIDLFQRSVPPTAPGTHQKRAPKWDLQHRLLWSLWQQLADNGAVRDRSKRSLESWVQRQTGVDRLEWVNPKQLDLLIESAKKWLARGGVNAGSEGSQEGTAVRRQRDRDRD